MRSPGRKLLVTIALHRRIFLVLAGIVHFLVTSSNNPVAALRLASILGLFSCLLGGSVLLRKQERHDVIHVLETGSKAEKMLALAEVHADPALWVRMRPMVAEILAHGETELRTRRPTSTDRQRGVSVPIVRRFNRFEDHAGSVSTRSRLESKRSYAAAVLRLTPAASQSVVSSTIPAVFSAYASKYLRRRTGSRPCSMSRASRVIDWST